ncbi:MAG TPA: efflux RND transporter periplasmic adaptor subunit [Vicinamibacterales bacterium]|nr:efflux RND transporter periplasmic adaptor subunit [Vicinamibacterales bacterium]
MKRAQRPPVVVLGLVCAAGLAGCSKPAVEEVESKAAAAVTTLTLAPQTVEGIVAASGTVNAAPGADWTITAPEHARIVEMPKAEGDRVKPGDLLVRFEIPSMATDVATQRAGEQAAQARVDNAQANLTRLTTLVDHGVAAQKELEDARRDLNEAQAALAQARAALQNANVVESRTIVRARFPGIVAKRGHNPGDMVEATSADVVLRIIDPARLQVVAAVPIPDLPRVQVGKAARILVPGADEPERGKVLSRPAAVEPTGISADVRLSFDAPTRLAAGTPVRVEIIAEQHPNALAVPVEAVIHEDENTFVMIAGDDKKAHKRKVTVGLTNAKTAELTGGVKAGEAVIVQGQQGLPDGADIVQAK